VTVTCSPSHLLWETLPDGLALYPFGRIWCEERWLADDAVLERIERLDRPAVYVDLGRTQFLSGTRVGRIVRLVVRARRVSGQVILCGVRPELIEVFKAVRLLPHRLNHPALPNWPIIHGRGVPGGARFPDPAWLAWGGGTVGNLARMVREGRDFDLMPVLGDALEDAGCTLPEVLEHCRTPGRHERDCWVIQLLLDVPWTDPAACGVDPDSLPSTG
jgi:anti-anti-sigma regulatory factor